MSKPEEQLALIMTCLKHSVGEKHKPDFDAVAQELGIPAKTLYHRHWKLLKDWGVGNSRAAGAGSAALTMTGTPPVTPKGAKRGRPSKNGSLAVNGNGAASAKGSRIKKGVKNERNGGNGKPADVVDVSSDERADDHDEEGTPTKRVKVTKSTIESNVDEDDASGGVEVETELEVSVETELDVGMRREAHDGHGIERGNGGVSNAIEVDEVEA